jgi:predicted transcriptional regulator
MTTKPRRVTVTLAEDIVGAADEVAAERACSRSALVEDALRWYLRVRDLAWDEASPEEIEAIERGRAEIARGEFVTFEEIKRDLKADLLEQRAKESEKASAE